MLTPGASIAARLVRPASTLRASGGRVGLEDAAVVLSTLSGRIERPPIAREVQLRAEEMPGHNVTERFRRVAAEAPDS